MESPLSIANYFIKKSFDTGEEITPMKAIKLVYIAHGWHLGIFDEDLLDEVVYAWKFGPVVDTVYRQFKRYGSSQITELYSEDGLYPLPSADKFVFLNAIWRAYGKFDGIKLSSITHQANTPWDIVWNQRGGCNQKNAIIPNDVIKEHYKEKIKQVNAQPAVQQPA